MTALAWQLVRVRGRRGDVRPSMVVATSEARDGRPGSAGTAEPRPSAADPAPDPGEPPDDREPDREPGGGPAAGQATAEANAGAPTGAHPTAPYAYPPSGPYAFPSPEQYAYPQPGSFGGPPPGPFGGPPPGEQGGWGPYAYPPPAQYGGTPAPGRRGRRRRTVIALVATVLLVAAAGAGIFYYERSARTVALLAADVPGDDPFTPTLVQSGSLMPTARFDATANRTPTGELDGLYLDSTGSSGCNRAPLESTLRGDPALATAWAAPLGVNAMQAPVYVAAGLTPVRLRADTRLTAHGNSGGRARPYAATLQAGTAVLVDDRGLPRVRCADGAPLTGALPLADPVYGSGWDGFDPATTIEIRPAGAKIVEFGLVDPAGTQPFRRPAGTAGEKDVVALPNTGRLDGTYLLTGNHCSVWPA